MRPLMPILSILALLAAIPAQAGWLEELRKLLDVPATPGGAGLGAQAAAVLSDEDVVNGLKEALHKGTRQAVASLGRDGGFLNNLDVRIPLPEELKKVDKLLRTLGQDKYADEFVATLNHAAERAVPEAASLFAQAISQMSLTDARAILKGPDDAATQYFRRASEARLKERFRPIVQAATDRAGVTAAYKKLMREAGPAAQWLGVDTTDLGAYVEGKAVDGLFRMIAAEEQRIRQDPLARTTELLKKVFGAPGR